MQMADRANNKAESRFKVGERVLLKNLKRDSKDVPRYARPGRITAAKKGSFSVELEDGSGMFLQSVCDGTDLI